MNDIIRFAKSKPISEIDQLIRYLQPSIDHIVRMNTAQLQPFIQNVEMMDYALDILYAPLQMLISELTELNKNGGYSKLSETQLRAFRMWLEYSDARHGTTLLYWLHGNACYQFHFIHTAEGNYTLFSVWVNDQNLFESALDQTAEHFNIPRQKLINNPFNR